MLEALHFQVIIRTPTEVYWGYTQAHRDNHTWNAHLISLPSAPQSQKETLETSSFDCSGILPRINLITSVGLLTDFLRHSASAVHVIHSEVFEEGICGYGELWWA